MGRKPKKEKTPTALQRWRIKRLTGAPRRLARRRGFGIHSPFAFDFVRRVIAQPCGFYCYGRLNEQARRDGLEAKSVRLLFRVALFFRTGRFAVVGSDCQAFRNAVRYGSPEAVEAADNPDLVIVAPDAGTDVPIIVPSVGAIVVFSPGRNREMLRKMWEKVDRGMIFRGSSIAVIVIRQSLPGQMFNVWI